MTLRHQWWLLLAAHHHCHCHCHCWYHLHHHRHQPLHRDITHVTIPVTGHTHHAFNCTSTQALPIPNEIRRPSPSVIIVVALETVLVFIFTLCRHWSSVLDFSAYIPVSALGIIAVGDGEIYITLYISCKLRIKWSFLPCNVQCVCALQTLVHCFIGQPRYPRTSLVASKLHHISVLVCSCIHTMSPSAKQADGPPVWSFGIQFGKPFGKHPISCLW